jgi:hypothetical protein
MMFITFIEFRRIGRRKSFRTNIGCGNKKIGTKMLT